MLFLLLVSVAPSAAQPQSDPSAGKIPVARRLYDEGLEAVGQGRWSIAYDRFKASYELSPRVLTLFNLAGSQLQTSRFVEASESYRRFLRETADGRYPELRAEATASLETIEKQIGYVTLSATNLDRGDVITIDDIAFPQSTLGEPIPLNPGAHTIAITRNGAVVLTRKVDLSPGAAEKVPLEAPKKANLQIQPVDGRPADLLATMPAPAKRDEAKGGVLRSPWFWTTVVVVIAGGATGAYLLTRPDDNTLVVR